MEQVTLEHANTFFFITTFAVAILIIILLVLLFVVYKVSVFLRKTMVRVDTLLDKAGDSMEESPVYKKAVPFILPIISHLFSKKGSRKKKM